MDSPSAQFRPLAISGLLWLSFLAACLFYGVGENLLLLFVSCGFLLAAFTLTPLVCWRALYREQKTSVWLCLYVLAVLTIGYQSVTISPDSSFAMSWVLAAVPIWYLVYAANPQRRWLQIALVSTIGVFALHSAVQFLSSGARAYEPLGDPNHYASLLYLVWIPVAHRVLLNAWQNNSNRATVAVSHLLLFTLALVVAATGSRVGMAVVVAALLGWLLLILIRRLPPAVWWWLLVNTAGAFLVCWLVVPAGLPGVVDSADFQTGVSIRSSLNAAALQMILEAPFAGTGVYTFPLLYPLFRLPGDQSTAGMFVHNDYLQLFLESGPWLVAALVVLIAAIARRLWLALFTAQNGPMESFGLAMAAAALMVHASVNFVLYFLPLGILLAVICAELFAIPVEQKARQQLSVSDAASGVKPPASVRAGWLAAVLLGLVGWGYLGLDVVIQGVFGGQAAPGFIGTLRRDIPTMLSFSDTARALNDKRVTPIVAEAMLFSVLGENISSSGVSTQAVLDRYRLALEMDPYNPAIYQQFYNYIDKSADAELIASLRADETPEALLLKVVQLELGRTPTVFTLLSVYDQQNRPETGLSMLKVSVYPWLERIQWAQPANARVMLAEMVRRAEAADDQNFLTQLEAKTRQLEHISPGVRVERLKLWQRQILR